MGHHERVHAPSTSASAGPVGPASRKTMPVGPSRWHCPPITMIRRPSNRTIALPDLPFFSRSADRRDVRSNRHQKSHMQWLCLLTVFQLCFDGRVVTIWLLRLAPRPSMRLTRLASRGIQGCVKLPQVMRGDRSVEGQGEGAVSKVQVLAVMLLPLIRPEARVPTCQAFRIKFMRRSLPLLVTLCALLVSCAQHPPPQPPVATQTPARVAPPHRVRHLASAANSKRTTPAKAMPAAPRALSCLESRSGRISEARAGELFAEFDNREQSGAAASGEVLPVSRACP